MALLIGQKEGDVGGGATGFTNTDFSPLIPGYYPAMGTVMNVELSPMTM